VTPPWSLEEMAELAEAPGDVPMRPCYDRAPMMTRRRFLATVSASLLAAPLAAGAQAPGRQPRLGWLVFSGPFTETSPDLEAAVLRGLRERGYVDGKTLSIEYRYAHSRHERLPELAADLVRLKVDLLLGIGGDVAAAFKGATSTVPIVVGMSTDPVRSQLAASLARPGGNLTGVTFLFDQLAAKRVELFREIVPQGVRLAVVYDPTHIDNDFTEVQAAARRLGIQLQPLEIRRPEDLEATLLAVVQARAEALIVVPGRLTAVLGKRIVESAAQQRIPVISGWREFASGGAVATYGPNRVEASGRLGGYVDKILRGAKPADLPIEQPSQFELVINLKSAKALGLMVPASLLGRADQIIE